MSKVGVVAYKTVTHPVFLGLFTLGVVGSYVAHEVLIFLLK